MADCKVQKVLFPAGKDGLWGNNVYVILTDAEDVTNALYKHESRIGPNIVHGRVAWLVCLTVS